MRSSKNRGMTTIDFVPCRLADGRSKKAKASSAQTSERMVAIHAESSRELDVLCSASLSSDYV